MMELQIAYLGFFDALFGWIIDLILTPVFKFVAGLLNTVFSWLFENILAPILLPVLKTVITWAFDLFIEIFSSVFYMILVSLLKIIDYMQIAFDVFIGFTDVSYRTSSGSVVKGNLLEILFQYGNVQTVFWILILGGLGIAFIFTIYAVSRSSFDIDFENKRTVSKVMTSFFKTFIQFFMTPFFVYFMLKLSVVILKGISTALGYSRETSLGKVLFVITSLDAAKNADMNVSTVSGAWAGKLGIDDSIRSPFYNGVKDYSNMKTVRDYFDLAKFDYLIGYIVSIFLIIILAICLITFVKRIFEIILLYIVSPYFIATMPLDDGEKFSQWRDVFLSKCFTGFGSAIGMRLYLLVCPMIMGNQIRLSTGASSETEYMIKLFFLIGGAWAVLKSGSLITSIFNFQSGQSEYGTGAMVSSYIYGNSVGRLMSYGQQYVTGSLYGRNRSDKERPETAGETGRSVTQAFHEGRDHGVGFGRRDRREPEITAAAGEEENNE